MNCKKHRKLFCELCPFTYKISVFRCRLLRKIENLFLNRKFAVTKSKDRLNYVVYKHNSLIRRQLGNVDSLLQENKSTNLSLAAPKINGILIQPGEIFSFWKLVGSCTAKKGYKEGLTISNGIVGSGIGGGMCQFTNLIHWMILHTPLEIIEYHHHDGMDLFPDYGRQVPFGVGTSILYNYLDYRFRNNTDITFQLIVYTTDIHLCGEIRTDRPISNKYHIKAEGEQFVKEADGIYRVGKVYRECMDSKTGNLISKQLIRDNYAKVLYDIGKEEVYERNVK